MFSLFLWYFSNLSDVGLYIFQVLYMKILEFCQMARVKKSQERLVRTMSPQLNYATDRDERMMWVVLTCHPVNLSKKTIHIKSKNFKYKKL